jgi:hypothetical protein
MLRSIHRFVESDQRGVMGNFWEKQISGGRLVINANSESDATHMHTRSSDRSTASANQVNFDIDHIDIMISAEIGFVARRIKLNTDAPAGPWWKLYANLHRAIEATSFPIVTRAQINTITEMRDTPKSASASAAVASKRTAESDSDSAAPASKKAKKAISGIAPKKKSKKSRKSAGSSHNGDESDSCGSDWEDWKLYQDEDGATFWLPPVGYFQSYPGKGRKA